MITVTILTKNSQRHLRDVLQSLISYNEVLVYDTGSTDNTLEIAQEFNNVTIHRGEFEGFGNTHNKASNLAKYDWILSIDSDEIVTPELSKEIHNLSLNPSFVYSIQRDNFYNGKWIKWCGWYPDRQYKLYNRKHTQFDNAEVHEAIIVKNSNVIPLKYSLHHYPYHSTQDFLSKMQHYSQLFAKQNENKKSSSILRAIGHGFFSFFKSYFLKRGFLGGAEGFIISVYNGNTSFYKYLKLRELLKNKKTDM